MDLSDRKQAENALRKSEERYRAFVEQSSEGIWCFELEVPISPNCLEDEQLQHFYQYAYLAECNDAMAKMYGYACAEEIIGTRLGHFNPPEDPQNIEYLRSFILSGYRLVDAESHEVDKHGNSKYFLNNLVGIVENGFLQRVWGTQRDITEHKLTLEALRQREDELRLITNALPVLIAHIDAQQRYRFNNKAYEEWFGISAAEIYGKHIREVLGIAVYESIRPYVEEVLSGKPVSYESQMPHKDATIRYFNATYVPQFKGEQVSGYIALISDITSRKLAAQEREQLLNSEQAARKEAEAANRLKDEFLATLSHELRTPLNSMVGWTQLLTTRKFDEATTERALETIDRNTKSLRRLVDDVLDVSQIIRGQLRLNFLKIELVPIIKAAIDTVRPAALAKSIDFRFSIFDLGVLSGCESIVSDRLAPKFFILGDANRLQQVMWNLLSNAVKFTPSCGTIEVRLSILGCRQETPHTPLAQITVSDTGEGISPEFLPHVFDRFRQADSSTTRPHGGLGLGLAIVRHLVELHGGTVCVSSPGIGKGATFIVNLPLTK